MKNIVWFLLAITSILASCSKMDDVHQPYLNDGDLHYVGAPYDVVVIAKVASVEVQFKKTADPTIHQYIVYWNNRANSQEVTASEKLVESVTIPDLATGAYTFELIAVDNAGNKSKTVSVAGIVN